MLLFATVSSVPCVLVLVLPAVRGVRRAERPPEDSEGALPDSVAMVDPVLEPGPPLARAS